MRPRTNKFFGRCGAGGQDRRGQVGRTLHLSRGKQCASKRAGRLAGLPRRRATGIERADWQTCTSLTYGVADAYDRDEVREALAAVAK